MILSDHLNALSYDELRCFCYDTPGYKRIYNRLTRDTTEAQLRRWISQHITEHGPPKTSKTARRLDVWNVPDILTRNFTGRETFLTDLRRRLTSGQPAALTQAISGLGGIGKTQLALKYATEYRSAYQIVWWLRAEEPVSLAADYAALATPLNLPERNDQEQRVIIAAVKRWLAQAQDWLLIFDNALEPEAIKSYIPPQAKSHILITSRNQSWRSVATSLTLVEMTEREALDFLVERTGQDDRTLPS